MMPNKVPSAARWRLALEIAYWRYAWRLPFAVGCAVVVLLVALWLPAQFARLANANQAFEREQINPVAAVKTSVPPLESFRQSLVMQDATPTQLRVLHQKAQELGLQPGQLDMRRQQGGVGVFSQLQVSMPLRGSYLSVKKFCGDVLESMSSVSIDQITIKRSESASGQVDAQIVLSLWQQPAAGQEGQP